MNLLSLSSSSLLPKFKKTNTGSKASNYFLLATFCISLRDVCKCRVVSRTGAVTTFFHAAQRLSLVVLHHFVPEHYMLHSKHMQLATPVSRETIISKFSAVMQY